MFRNERLKIIIKTTVALLVLFILLFSSIGTTSYAETAQERLKRIEKEIKAAKGDRKYIQDNITRSVSAISELKGQIEEKDREIAKLEDQIKETRTEVDQISNDLTKQEEEYAKQEDLVKKRLTFMYESGQNKTWEILLKSNGVMDFLSNYYMLQELSKLDNEILSESSRDKRRIEVLKSELDSKKKVLEEDQERVEKSKIVQQNLITLKEANIKKLNKEEKAVLAKLDNLAEQEKAAEREIERQLASYIGDKIYVGGEFAWPVPGCTYISTHYGDGPAQGYYWAGPRGHQGLDIADDEGTPIVASNGGRVILSQDYGGYGNCVIIDHGGGYITLYAHGSKRLVSVGQIVKRGQRIMLMGNTGFSFGSHLHFELLKGASTYDPDKRVNPLPYVTSAR